jgi:hypothetical protein
VAPAAIVAAGLREPTLVAAGPACTAEPANSVVVGGGNEQWIAEEV